MAPTNGTEVGFGDLPPEIVSHIAALLPVADMARLAATCRAIHALTTCRAMWRRLFLRDFAQLYAKGLSARPWPYRDHPDDPWHEMAVELWRDTDALSAMPPRCRPVEHLPPPFAHAFAVGKDWRWLYRAHLATSSEAPDESFSGPRGFRPDPSTLLVVDWTVGLCFGYAVRITFGGPNNDEVVSWIETMPTQGAGDRSWSVECTATNVTHQGATDASGTIPVFIFLRAGVRYWLTLDESKTGAFAGLSTDGTRHYGRCCDGDIETSTSHYLDGSTVAGPARNGKSHGEYVATYANGDVARAHYVDGGFADGIEFACSLTCQSPEYAGRVISACAWRMVSIDVEGSPAQVMVPADGGDDARLFWRYVAEGLVGWCPHVRRLVLDTVGGSVCAPDAGQRDAKNAGV